LQCFIGCRDNRVSAHTIGVPTLTAGGSTGTIPASDCYGFPNRRNMVGQLDTLDRKDVPRRALLIVNHMSRDGKSCLNSTKDVLRGHGIETINPSCDSKEDLHSIILELGPAVDMIIIAGGDGTLNAAAGAVHKVRRSMGIIPTGTANDLARTLHIPTDLDKAIRIIANGNTRAIDLGSVNDKLFSM
jgi:predicted polyphosphate/ATP-dependent NAD kinase